MRSHITKLIYLIAITGATLGWSWLLIEGVVRAFGR